MSLPVTIRNQKYVCLSVIFNDTKNHHFNKRLSQVPAWDTKNNDDDGDNDDDNIVVSPGHNDDDDGDNDDDGVVLSHQAKAEECTAPTNDGRSESRRSRAGTWWAVLC